MLQGSLLQRPEGTKRVPESMTKKVNLWSSPVSFVVTLLIMVLLWLHTQGKIKYVGKIHAFDELKKSLR